MNNFNRLAILVIISMLSACTPTTENQATSIDIPAYLNESNNSDLLKRLPSQAWWQSFEDPQLNQLIDKALIYNNDISIAKQSISVSLAELKTVRLNWLPGLNVLAGFSQNPALGNPGIFYGILPSYYLNFFTLYFQQKTAEFALLRTKAYSLGVRLTVIGQVMNSYFSLLAWNYQLELLNQIETDYKKLLISVTVAKTQGLANNLQLLTLKSRLQEILGLQKQIQNNILAAENSLLYLINEPPGQIKSNNSFLNLPDEAVPLSKINAQVIFHRPDVMVAWSSLRAACSGINVSESQFLEPLSLDDFTGKASLRGRFKSPTHTAQFRNAYATFNLSPTLLGKIFTSKAIFKKRLAEYNNVTKNALRLIANSIIANQKMMEKYSEDKLSLDVLIKRYQLQKDLYRKGLISHNELLYSQIEIHRQDFEVTLSKLEQLLSVVSLYQELAAGIHYRQVV